MKKVCLCCYEIYDYNIQTKKYNSENWTDSIFCPKSNCYGEVVDIDDNMVHVIIELNKKGYRTKYCCGGHSDEMGGRLYIVIDNEQNFNFDYKNKKFDELTPPDGFRITKDILGGHCDYVLESTMSSDNIKGLDLQKSINEKNTTLCTWIKYIPDLN